MRLIDADALKNMRFSCGMLGEDHLIYAPIREVFKNIDKAPTIGVSMVEMKSEEAIAPTICEGAEGEEVICCGSCGTSLYHLFPWIKINKAREFVQYCRHCGREVKWE